MAASRDHDIGEPLAEGGHLRRVARRHGVHQPSREAAEHLGEECGPQVPAALEERFGRGVDPREQRLAPVEGIGQGLAQRLGSAQDHGRPEPHQRVERPGPLALGPAHSTKDRVTQRRGDVRLQQLDDPQQVDLPGRFHVGP
jgi:hypothetical protein